MAYQTAITPIFKCIASKQARGTQIPQRKLSAIEYPDPQAIVVRSSAFVMVKNRKDKKTPWIYPGCFL